MKNILLPFLLSMLILGCTRQASNLGEEELSKYFSGKEFYLYDIIPDYIIKENETEVIFIGEGFSEGMTIVFNDNYAKVTFVNSTNLIVLVPKADYSGPATIKMKSNDGRRYTCESCFTYV